jgi:alpha-N-arabinofuranosidase
MDPKNDISTSCEISGVEGKTAVGQILTAADVSSHNTFEQPDRVVLAEFRNVKWKDGLLKLVVPAKSVITVEIK